MTKKINKNKLAKKLKKPIKKPLKKPLKKPVKKPTKEVLKKNKTTKLPTKKVSKVNNKKTADKKIRAKAKVEKIIDKKVSNKKIKDNKIINKATKKTPATTKKSQNSKTKIVKVVDEIKPKVENKSDNKAASFKPAQVFKPTVHNRPIPSKPTKFEAGNYAFYPSHGVGKILDIETIVIDKQKFEFLIMFFEKEKLTIKIPVSQIDKVGLRPLISKTQMEEIFDILRSGVKKLKGMWSRRAQEYESKINSGNITLLAEVLRDLTRDIEDGDRSYSERIIYETAINRLALEYSVIANIAFEEAKEKIVSTAKQKLGLPEEVKEPKRDNFDDDFDAEEESEEEDEDEDEDYEEDDEDEDKPKKRSRKKK